MKIQYEYYDETKQKIKARYATTDDGKLWIGPFEEYYENGNLKRKGQYINKEFERGDDFYCSEEKRRTGAYVEYYENGTLKRQCSYIDGVLDGKDESFTPSGKRYELITYQKGVKEGEYEIHTYGKVSYHEFGWFKEKGFYHADKHQGLCEHYYEIDKSMNETQYYYNGGVNIKEVLPDYFKFQFKCYMADGQMHGDYEGFHRVTEGWDGAYAESAYNMYFGGNYPWTVCHYEKGLREGAYVSFHLNGQKAEECSFEQGQLEGKYLLSYPDGVFHIKATYHEGKRIGLCEVNENGTITQVKYNENGKMEGQKSFFKFGATEPYGSENYKDGVKEGEYRFYNPNTGRLQSCGHYVNGKQDGICEYYDDAGVLKYKEIYEKGKLIKNCMPEEEEKKATWKNKQFERSVVDFMRQRKQHSR